MTQLEITDPRVAVVTHAPMTCPIVRIATNQAGLYGLGEVRGVEKPVVNQGTIAVPDRPGLGVIVQVQILEDDTRVLEARLEVLRRQGGSRAERLADAAVFLKGARWALRYEPNLSASDQRMVQKAVARATQRIEALERGSCLWERKKGRVVRGYTSKVDGSVQPYGLVIPQSYDPARPTRLDIVLHGSTRPTGMSELQFLMPFDDGDEGGQGASESYIELHPLGRVENCYRWAGESDVFEAIEDVCRCYAIDRDRLVLRGMSMGASGTWHLGLKHPDFFVALGPYCGYVDTHRFSETPGMNFVRVGSLPPHQEAALHLLDSVDYAANAGIVPAIAAIGEKDPFFQAHVIMGEAFQREGLKMVNLISPGTAHVQDPATFREQLSQIEQYAQKGLDHLPRRLRFVTWSLKYARCHWIQLLGLERHYQRAEIEAELATDGSLRIKEPRNVTRFALLPAVLAKSNQHLTVGKQEVRLPPQSARTRSQGVLLVRRGQKWSASEYRGAASLAGKQPGLQGPIDDAFTTPFLCVRGTGKAWNPSVQGWAETSLQRFASAWSRYFRGELPLKDDNAVTADDCRRCNLILFGDPGSNSWIRKALPALPMGWTREVCQLGSVRYPATDHAPALICPSPFTPKRGVPRYLVLNSGHTFHEAELNRLNYLLFPHLGDWAIFNTSAPDEALQSGYWDEHWR